MQTADNAIRRLTHNAINLLGSNAIQSICVFVTTLVVARYLGVNDFGKLSLITSYSLVITQLVSFQSTYAVIKIGIAARERDGVGQLLGVYKVGVAVDFAAAVVASVIALLGIYIGAEWFQFSKAELSVAVLFAAGICTNATGSAIGILRVCDRYRVFVWHGVISGLSRVALTAIALWFGGGLLLVGIAWLLATVISNLALIGFGVSEASGLRKPGMRSSSISETLRQFPELRRMLVNTNLTTTMRMVRDTDVLLVGWLLGPSGSGLFRIARQVGSIIMKAVDPFFQAIYPALVEAREQGEFGVVKKLIVKSSLLVGGGALMAFLAFLVVGEPILGYTLGAEYQGAYAPAAWCILGGVIWAFTYPLSPALMAWNRHGLLLKITGACSLIYIAAVLWSVDRAGILGGSIAYVIFLAVWSISVGIALLRQLRDNNAYDSH